MSTTYCLRVDVEDIMGIASVVALCDDDQDGVLSVAEVAYITGAISRGAVEVNIAVATSSYDYASLTSNVWVKWCNAYLAAYYLSARKNNPPSASVMDAVQRYRQNLQELQYGRFLIPEQTPDHDSRPTVSNFRPEIYKQSMPIRVVEEESTGAKPEGGLKREPAYVPGYL